MFLYSFRTQWSAQRTLLRWGAGYRAGNVDSPRSTMIHENPVRRQPWNGRETEAVKHRMVR